MKDDEVDHATLVLPARFPLVASGAAIHRLPLPDVADSKETFDLGAAAQGGQLVVRGSRDGRAAARGE